MNTGTGVLSIVVALGALIVSAANSKNAEARPSYSNAIFTPKAAPSNPGAFIPAYHFSSSADQREALTNEPEKS